MNTSQLQWARTRIRSAAIVNGKYELDVQRETNMGNLLFIPGLTSPVAEIRQLLFGQGQPGGSWIPTLSAAMIAANTFGSGVTDILDLSGNNNPFSQATPASRGAWFREPKTGRRNLATWTDALTAGVASNVSISTGDASPFSAPFQEITNTSGTEGFLRYTLLSMPVGAYCHSIFVKAGTSNIFRLRDVSGNTEAWFDLAAGTVAQGAGSIESLGNGVFRCSVNGSISSVSNKLVDIAPASTVGQRPTTIGSSVQVVAFQVETGSTPTAYQRVTTAFDVTESGQRDCYGVRGDGTDDGYATAGNVDFSGTPIVTVFAAVRKLSDSTGGVIAELGTSASNVGMFGIFDPLGNTSPQRTIAFTARTATAVTSEVVAPTTYVASAIADRAAQSISIRRNGILAGSNIGTLGTGTFGSDVLNLFRRNATSLPFNGNLYALIVAGGSYPLSTIQRVERILSRITPTVNL